MSGSISTHGSYPEYRTTIGGTLLTYEDSVPMLAGKDGSAVVALGSQPRWAPGI